jgi:predicted outer membrane repeat protein
MGRDGYFGVVEFGTVIDVDETDLWNDGGDGGDGGDANGVFYGNAVYAEMDADLTISGCTFERNTAAPGQGGAGGGGGLVEDWLATENDYGVPGLAGVVGQPSFVFGYGGAVYCEYLCKVDVDDSAFLSNDARTAGGAIYCEHDVKLASVADTKFSQNSTLSGAGGAVYAEANLDANFSGCIFTGNRAEVPEGAPPETMEQARGGAIDCNTFTQLSFVDCTFSENDAKGAGGAVYCRGRRGQDDYLTIERTRFSDNNSLAMGGGIFFHECDADVLHCSMLNNTAPSGGGMYLSNTFADDSTVNILGSSFWGNHAESELGAGGAIITLNTSLQLVNCDLGENLSNDVGGAVAFLGISEPYVKNCLFTRNYAEKMGGAIASFLSADPDVINCTFSLNRTGLPAGKGGSLYYDIIGNRDGHVTNCILEGSIGGAIYDARPSVPAENITYNLFHDNDYDYYNGTTFFEYIPQTNNNRNVDPLFVDGPLGDFYLSQSNELDPNAPDSPALNAGSDLAADLGLSENSTTSTDHSNDVGQVDIGYHYDVKLYELTIVTIGAGTVIVEPDTYDPNTGSYSGSFFELTAVPAEGWRVRSWTGADHSPAWGTTENTIRLRSDQTVTVEFELDTRRALHVGASGYQSIEEAIRDAGNGDIITIHSGTRVGTRFVVDKNITITGTNPDDANVVAATIIDCNGDQGEHAGGFDLQGDLGADTARHKRGRRYHNPW